MEPLYTTLLTSATILTHRLSTYLLCLIFSKTKKRPNYVVFCDFNLKLVCQKIQDIYSFTRLATIIHFCKASISIRYSVKFTPLNIKNLRPKSTSRPKFPHITMSVSTLKTFKIGGLFRIVVFFFKGRSSNFHAFPSYIVFICVVFYLFLSTPIYFII